MNMNAELTELVFILDRSGSMGGLESDTIAGFNGLIERQKKENEKVNVTPFFLTTRWKSFMTVSRLMQYSH